MSVFYVVSKSLVSGNVSDSDTEKGFSVVGNSNLFLEERLVITLSCLSECHFVILLNLELQGSVLYSVILCQCNMYEANVFSKWINYPVYCS